MKKLLYFFFFLFGLALSVALTPSNAYGAGCTPIYGGGVECPPEEKINLDKTVKNPESGLFIDNLTVNDRKFLAGQVVFYQVIVENTSDSALSDVVIKDHLPDYLDFVSGAGSYSASNKELTITINTLGAREKRTFDIKAKVVDVANLPADKSVICVVNKASVTADGEYDEDTSQVCIEKRVLGAPELPEAGPVENVAMAAGLVALYFVGKKLTKLNI